MAIQAIPAEVAGDKTNPPERLRTGLKSALASLEARLGLVDDVNPALATDDLVVAVAATQRFQRVTDFHSDL
jgi:hypothetical protein